MSASGPIIGFGQQPCGFLPRRFLAAKIVTARRLQQEIGGEIVFFWHDSDHDPRETQTLLRHRHTGAEARLNFAVASRVQRKWSPLFLKRIAPGWKDTLARQLPAYVEPEVCEAVRAAQGDDVASFCLEAYARLGLLAGLRVVRSGDPAVRRAACSVDDYFLDVPHEGEIVRARVGPGGSLRLHEGGRCYLDLPSLAPPHPPAQISPARDTRLKWMQSVLQCTHYIAGAGEQAYLRTEDAPGTVFLPRQTIDRSDEAFTEILRPDTVRL